MGTTYEHHHQKGCSWNRITVTQVEKDLKGQPVQPPDQSRSESVPKMVYKYFEVQFVVYIAV